MPPESDLNSGIRPGNREWKDRAVMAVFLYNISVSGILKTLKGVVR